MSVLLVLLAMLTLLLLKGFFSGSEIALVSTDRIKLRHRAANGAAGARLAMKLLKNPTRLLTTTLLGTNISSVALTTIGTILMAGLFGASGEIIALIVFTPIFLILGEIVPKSVYQQKADILVPIIAYPLSWLQTVLAPLVWLFSMIAGLAARLIGGRQSEDGAAREQFLATVKIAEKTGAAEAFKRGQVRRVLRFAQMTAAEAMWPITEVHCISHDADMGQLLEIQQTYQQRLIPYFEDVHTNITGVLALEDWDLLDPDIAQKSPMDFCGSVSFVPQFQKVSEVLEKLRDNPDHTVIVVDEMGIAVGFITLGHLVRQTLGTDASAMANRIMAKHRNQVERSDEGHITFDAKTSVAKVNEVLSTTLSTLHFNSIGGLALAQFGRIPNKGDHFDIEGYRFEIVGVTERRILKIRASIVTG